MNGDDSDRVGDDILRELVSDGERPAPAAARARVLARLGVAAAAGSAAALNASAAVAFGKAASHSAAPATDSVLGFSLAKALVAHPIAGIVATLAVGSGVGIGAYQAFEPAQRPTPAVVAHPTAPKPNAKPTTNRARTPSAGISAAAPVARAPDVAFPEPAADVPAQRVPAVPAAPVHARDEKKSEPSSLSGRAVTPSEPANLVPAPDLPAVRSARLAEQQTLLDQARASLRRGDGAGALAIVSGHESLYPVTEFAEERGAIRILSLVMTGQRDDALRHAERFAKRFPTSLFLPALRKALGDEPIRSNEPEAHD